MFLLIVNLSVFKTSHKKEILLFRSFTGENMTVLNRRDFLTDHQYLIERQRLRDVTWDHLYQLLNLFLRGIYRRICSLPDFVYYQRLCYIFDREIHLLFDDFYNGEGVFANIGLYPSYND